jgi:DNA repair protein RadC
MSSTIKTWAEDDRPREKLFLKGAEHLSNSELLAILINSGTPQSSALDIAKQLLEKMNNSCYKLGKLTVNDILQLKIKGIGSAKAITIVAALEIGLRREMAENRKEKISKSADIAHFLKAQLQHKSHEVFVTVYLNRANKIVHHEIVSEGGITGTVADARIIIKKALENNAIGLVLAHNHPSGNLSPSNEDIQVTQKIKTAAAYFDIKVLDHIIVSNEGYFSFADEGIM